MFIRRVSPGISYRSFMFLADLFTDAPKRVRSQTVADCNDYKNLLTTASLPCLTYCQWEMETIRVCFRCLLLYRVVTEIRPIRASVTMN